MSDACDGCGGQGRVPKVKGAYDVWVTCKKCGGTGRRNLTDDGKRRW